MQTLMHKKRVVKVKVRDVNFTSNLCNVLFMNP